MTTTVTVLSTDPPDAQALVSALAAAGADVTLDDSVPGYISVVAADGALLFHAETPSLIHVAGEARRLLGRDEPGLPYWWLEMHVPAAAPSGALPLARAVAGALVK